MRNKLVLAFMLACCLAITAALPLAGTAAAQTRIAVIGDSLAQDLWFGLNSLYGSKDKRKFLKHTKPSSGLVKRSFYNWNAQVDRIAQGNLQIAIVMIGGNDRQPFGGKRRFSKAWLAAYRARVDQFAPVVEEQDRPGLLGRSPGRPVKPDVAGLQEAQRNLCRQRRGQRCSIHRHLFWTAANKGMLRDDGLHFTQKGVAALARRVGKILF